MFFSPSQWLFALKMYLAVMVSFMVSTRLGLDKNYWTILTCCIIMNPVSGELRSKSVYRFVGTLCAGFFSLFFASFAASNPVLMVALVGIASSVGYSCSQLDRTPRSYGFSLFSLTLILMVLPSINNPYHIFDIIVARVFEVGLAVVCCTLIDSIIAPISLKPVVSGKLDKWLQDMQLWTREAFEGRISDDEAYHDRLKALADMSSFSSLSSKLRYDFSISAKQRRTAFSIQMRFMRMVPLLSAISYRVADADSDNQQKIKAILINKFEDIHKGKIAPKYIENEIIDLKATENEEANWRSLVYENLTELTNKALLIWKEIYCLKDSLETNATLPDDLEEEVKRIRIRAFPLQPDTYHASRVLLGTLLTYTILSITWWLTGWAQIPGAMIMGTTAIAFFGIRDKPDAAMIKLGRFIGVMAVIGAISCYFLLPLTRDSTTFALAMAMIIIPIGAWSTVNPIARLILAITFSTMNLRTAYSPTDIGYFIESFASNFYGLYIAFISLSMFRSMVTDHALKRLMHQGKKDIRNLTKKASKKDKDLYINRAMNRIGSLALRLESENQIDRSTKIMRYFKAGVCIAEMRECSYYLSEELRMTAERLFESLRDELFVEELSPNLLERIDDTIRAAWKNDIRSAKAPFLRTLISLRLALFEFAPAWRAQQ